MGNSWFEYVNACQYSVMFLLVSTLGGMRGYEVVWTDLAALRYDVRYAKQQGDYTGLHGQSLAGQGSYPLPAPQSPA